MVKINIHKAWKCQPFQQISKEIEKKIDKINKTELQEEVKIHRKNEAQYKENLTNLRKEINEIKEELKELRLLTEKYSPQDNLTTRMIAIEKRIAEQK